MQARQLSADVICTKQMYVHQVPKPLLLTYIFKTNAPYIIYIYSCHVSMIYISQLIRYARDSSNYSDFLKRHLHLRNRLLDQGYKKNRPIRSLKKFIFRYQDLVEIYSVSAEKIIKKDGFSYCENV